MLFDTQDAGQSLVDRAGHHPHDRGASRRRRCCSAALPRGEDALVPNVWTLGVGPGEPTEDALLVYNTTNAEATVTVQAVTADGLVNVPGLEALTLPAAGILPISLIDPVALDAQLVAAGDGAGVRRAVDPAGARRPGPHLVLGRPGRLRRADRGPRPRRRRHRRRRRRRRRDRPAPPARRADAAGAVGAGAARPRRLRPPRRAVARRGVHVGDVPHVRRRRRQGRGAGERRRRRRPRRVAGAARTSTSATASTACRCSSSPTAAGVVRGSFAGPVSATDLWAAVAAARDEPSDGA